MCGILACICNNKDIQKSVLKSRQHYVDLSKRVRHRGPD